MLKKPKTKLMRRSKKAKTKLSPIRSRKLTLSQTKMGKGLHSKNLMKSR